jgi:predicted house-cleaning noncanonical NTP pyrophosphatase (MazG superfamily)
MRSFELNKLVRDKIVPEMLELGQKPVAKTLNGKDYLQALVTKLLEEAKELNASDTSEALKELADLLEVIEALAKAFGADFDKLRTVQADRKTKRGGFEDRTYGGRLDLADDDPWVNYYAKEPE